MRPCFTESQFSGAMSPRTVSTRKTMVRIHDMEPEKKAPNRRCQSFMIPETGYMKISIIAYSSFCRVVGHLHVTGRLG